MEKKNTTFDHRLWTSISPLENPQQVSASNFHDVIGVGSALPPLLPAPLTRHPLLQDAAAVPPRGLRREARGPCGCCGGCGCGCHPTIRGASAAVGSRGGADGRGARAIRDALCGWPRWLAADASGAPALCLATADVAAPYERSSFHVEVSP
jgi:hypothetical protein